MRAPRAESAEAFEVDVTTTVDVLSNVSGGVRRTTEVPSTIDAVLNADLETLAGWDGMTLHLHGLGIAGRSFSAAVGDLQVVSSIEAPETVRLYEAWIEKELGPRTTLLAGLYDLTTEFDIIPSAALFVHSGPGTGSEFASSGRNGPSTYPFTSVGVRLGFRPTEETYVFAAVADGVAGDPADPEGTQIRFDDGDGLLLATEVGREQEGSSKTAFGAWGYTSDFQDFFRVDGMGQPLDFEGTWGAYAFAERPLSPGRVDSLPAWSGFLRAGVADERANLFSGYLGAGLVCRAPFRDRDEDRFGIALAAAHLSEDFRTAAALGGRDLERWEVAVELTYSAVLTPWLTIQPDLQVVLDPGGDADLGDAVVLGARVVLTP